jgi:hypothetical protein
VCDWFGLVNLVGVDLMFVLKKKNVDVCRFDVLQPFFGADPGIDVIDLIRSDLLPFGVEPDELFQFLQERFIPKNRYNAEALLSIISKDGVTDFGTLLRRTEALSLIDDFWVLEEGFEVGWEEINLFANRFSDIIAEIALMGFSEISEKVWGSSPEFTTGGVLPKAWKRNEKRIIQLWKRGTFGGRNTGNEPYAEFYAAQVANRLGLSHVHYDLKEWKGVLCSVCDLFTSEDVSFVPATKWIGNQFPASLMIGMRRSESIYQSLADMILFDFLIRNTDRHLNNFGVLQDNQSGEVLGLAPVFDNGSSMLCSELEDTIGSELFVLQNVLFTRFVRLDEFKSLMTERQFSLARKMLGFKFEKHGTYDWPDWRLSGVEDYIQKKVRMLLGEGK